MTYDDPALAAALSAGDPAAEAALVERFRPGVALILRKLVKDAALADDLTQEVFRVALESLRAQRLEDDRRLAAYLWGIARNVGNSELRRRRQRRPPEPVEDLVDARLRPDQALLWAERMRLVREAVIGLAERDRRVLEAFYLHDEPKHMICRRLSLSPSQFDVIKWRALRRLEALLREREHS